MRITDLFSSGHPFPSLEIVPPLSGITQRELLDSIRPLMDFQPRYINVTTHRDELQYTPLPDGSYKREVVRNRVSPVAVCACIQAHFPVEVVPHIICSGHTAREIEWQLQDFHFMGIDNVMALPIPSQARSALLRNRTVTHTPANSCALSGNRPAFAWA